MEITAAQAPGFELTLCLLLDHGFLLGGLKRDAEARKLLSADLSGLASGLDIWPRTGKRMLQSYHV